MCIPEEHTLLLPEVLIDAADPVPEMIGTDIRTRDEVVRHGIRRPGIRSRIGVDDGASNRANSICRDDVSGELRADVLGVRYAIRQGIIPASADNSRTD